MDDPQARLVDAFGQMGDEELMERWSGGYLTDVAIEAARREFVRRGITPPPYVAKDPDEPAGHEPESLQHLLGVSGGSDRNGEAPGEFVEVANSSEDDDLEAAAARLGVEGVPYSLFATFVFSATQRVRISCGSSWRRSPSHMRERSFRL